MTLADFDPGHNTGSTGFPILTSPVDLTSHPPVRFILSVYSTPYLLIPRLFFLAAATAAAFCVFFFCCCWRLCKLCCYFLYVTTRKKTAAKKQKSGKASARTGRLPQSINANFGKRNQEHDSCYPLPRISAEDFTHISFNLWIINVKFKSAAVDIEDN